MDLVEAADRFDTAMRHCDNLVSVHIESGGPDRGWRDEETSINRAVVVLTVAAWQAAVQDMVEAALDAGSPAPGASMSTQTYSVLQGPMRQQVISFSTPDADKTKRLFAGVGFNPRPLWTWSQMGGQGVGRITITPTTAEAKMKDWLSLRHDIAHGHDHLSQVSVLEAVREKSNPPTGWHPGIRLVDARACMAFFRRICRLTAAGLGAHLGQPSGSWGP
jgi:hypothetical protein